MNYEILEALGQIAREKNVSQELVLETLEMGLLSAAKRRYGAADNITVSIDHKTGDLKVTAIKTVVENVMNPMVEIELDRAVLLKPDARLGDDVLEDLNLADFGRNAIQTAKQVLVQRIREAERERIYSDFFKRTEPGHEHERIISGTVQQVNRSEIILGLGRTEAVIPLKEQIRREKYRQGDTVRAYILDVQRTSKGPQVTLSRTHPKFLERLFEIEVPEIYEGIVQVKAVARDPGERSKIAVVSSDDRVDPVGACVGVKGTRVQAIVRELSNERIDIVPWNPDPGTFVARALSPAVVLRTVVDPPNQKIIAIVADDQRSLAIGKTGQNARLAAQLTGWNIDILTEEEYQAWFHSVHQETGQPSERVTPLIEIYGVGTKMIERLHAGGIYSAEDLTELSEEVLCQIPGIGQATAAKLLRGAQELIDGGGYRGEETNL
ncbi:MAG: transcription termination/antitermination protein NusA [Candidatus Latescibacteria bacterium]|nr:transcription termination/antitermination protein NusA [Candidatus Latescibacterota bacterium]